jgi:hypothetical protein
MARNTLEALRALNAVAIVPGRGEAMKGLDNVNKALDYTKRWVETLFTCGKEAAAKGLGFESLYGSHPQEHGPRVWSRVYLRALLAI